MLKKINIEVWLEDQEGEEIPHRVPTTERNKRNEINAIVEIEGGKAYTVHWRLAEGLEPISTWNDVFVVDASSESRKAAKSWMDKRKADTQTRSSDQRLETHFRNGLKTPRVPGENLGAVRLEIRRVRGEITVKCIKGQTDVITLDIIDDEREGKPPWTVFHFTFKNIGLKKARPAASAARGMRAPPSDVSACRDNYGIPSKPLTRQRARQAQGAGGATPSHSSDVDILPPGKPKPHRKKSFTTPSESELSSDEYQDDAETPPPRKSKRRRGVSSTPSESDPSLNEEPEVSRTPPSRKVKRRRQTPVTPPSGSSPDNGQESEVARSKRHRRDFPTPASSRAPNDADDEATILRKRTEAAERALEEEMRQFENLKEIEQLYQKQLEIDKKKKKLQAKTDAQKKRIAKLQREVDGR